MTIPSKDKERLNFAIESAADAFWADIAASYPEAEYGDFSPSAAFALDAAQKEAVTLWLEWNADPQQRETKTTEILLHRIEYTYDDEELKLLDVDKEHITDQITNGFSEGELIVNTGGNVVRGYWKINNNPDV